LYTNVTTKKGRGMNKTRRTGFKGRNRNEHTMKRSSVVTKPSGTHGSEDTDKGFPYSVRALWKALAWWQFTKKLLKVNIAFQEPASNATHPWN
jgi:hypothetical protein